MEQFANVCNIELNTSHTGINVQWGINAPLNTKELRTAILIVLLPYLASQMNLKPITTKQFIWWIATSGIGVAFWIFLPQSLISLSGSVLFISAFFVQTPSEHREPVTRMQVFLVCVWIIACFVGIYSLRHWDSNGQARELLRFMKHPGFILSFWCVAIYVVHQRWRLGKQVEEEKREG